MRDFSAKDQVKQALGAHFNRLQLVDTDLGKSQAAWSFQDTDLDAEIPQSVRKRGAVHEVLPRTHQDGPAAAGFALALALQFLNPQYDEAERAKTTMAAHSPPKRPSHQPRLLWCSQAGALQEWGPLYGPGLVHFGIDPQAILHLRLKRSIDVLWALEEALKSKAVDLIIGEVAEMSLTASRRLALLAQTNQLNPILLGAPTKSASAAWVQWQLSAAPSAPHPFYQHAPGRPRWHVKLARSRSVQTGHGWILEWGLCTKPPPRLFSEPSDTVVDCDTASTFPPKRETRFKTKTDAIKRPHDCFGAAFGAAKETTGPKDLGLKAQGPKAQDKEWSAYYDRAAHRSVESSPAFHSTKGPCAPVPCRRPDDATYRFHLVSKLADRSAQNTHERNQRVFSHGKTG